jgi:hypothetical protein
MNMDYDSMQHYLNANKTKRPEIAILSWMIEPKHNNVIISIEGTGTKLVLDNLESSIWNMINDNYGTLENLLKNFTKNQEERLVQIIRNLEKERVILLRSNSIWEEEDEGVQDY